MFVLQRQRQRHRTRGARGYLGLSSQRRTASVMPLRSCMWEDGGSESEAALSVVIMCAQWAARWSRILSLVAAATPTAQSQTRRGSGKESVLCRWQRHDNSRGLWVSDRWVTRLPAHPPSHTHHHHPPFSTQTQWTCSANGWVVPTPIWRTVQYAQRVYVCVRGGGGDWMMGGDGARGARLEAVFKDVATAPCQCAWYCGSTTTARSNSPWIGARAAPLSFGCGAYGGPIHAPKPQSAANPMTEEADLWLHSHTWFHYALVKRVRLLQTRRCRCSVSFGRGCGWKDGGGKGWRETPRGKKIGYEKGLLLRDGEVQGRIWEIGWTGHFAW